MTMTLRDVLSAVLGEGGFLVPTSFVGSNNPDDEQMVYLANRAGAFIREKQFQRLRKRYEITLTASETYDLPSDYLEIIPDTMMVVGRVDAVRFPTRADFWAYLQSTSGPAGFTVNARILEGELNIFQPTAGDVLAFEYISNTPILDPDGVTYKTRFTNDNDTWLMDDDLLILETKWRWKKAKGLPDWQADEAECANYRIAVRGRDSGAQTITQAVIPYNGEPFTNLWINP